MWEVQKKNIANVGAGDFLTKIENQLINLKKNNRLREKGRERIIEFFKVS